MLVPLLSRGESHRPVVELTLKYDFTPIQGRSPGQFGNNGFQPVARDSENIENHRFGTYSNGAIRTHAMDRADGTFYRRWAFPWVETHGYKIYRADGSLVETIHTKRYEAFMLPEQIVTLIKSTPSFMEPIFCSR
jgi:hypothetical protein